MTTSLRRLLLIAVIAFVAALAGTVAGRQLLPQKGGVELHDVLHERLDLDSQQEAQIETLERRFAVRRKALELEMRAENARLADAIMAEHGNGPQVTAAIERSHHVMGVLQKETLAHLFSMRKLLRPHQAAKFDQAVMKALTADAR